MKHYLLPLTGLSVSALLLLGAGCTQPTTTTNTTITNNAVTPQNNNNSAVATDGPVELNEEFNLKANESIVVSAANLEMQFIGVTNDSRCPVDAQCITAGNVTVEFNVTVNGTTEKTAVTGSGSSELPAPVEVLGYRITMLEVTPQPKSGETTAADDYVVTFTINSMDTSTTIPQ